MFFLRDFSKKKLDELAAIPEGLRVTHRPNPVAARPGGRSGAKYTWLHSTAVESVGPEATITEFGAFTWDWIKNRWVFGTIYGRPFNADEFAEWYNCPGAKLGENFVAIDRTNYSGGDALTRSRTLWYFVAETVHGGSIKGDAVVEYLPRLA